MEHFSKSIADVAFRGNNHIPALRLVCLPGQAVQPKLIDVHEHLDGDPGFLDQLLARLNAADGIGILLTTPKGLPEASRFIQQHPDRFVGFGDIELDDPDVLNQIDRFHRVGFRGLGEITSSLKNYDDPVYWPIYDRAAKYHMILLFHTGIVARPHPRAGGYQFRPNACHASRSDCPALAERRSLSAPISATPTMLKPLKLRA